MTAAFSVHCNCKIFYVHAGMGTVRRHRLTEKELEFSFGAAKLPVIDGVQVRWQAELVIMLPPYLLKLFIFI